MTVSHVVSSKDRPCCNTQNCCGTEKHKADYMRPEPLRSPGMMAPERSVEIARAVQAARLEFAFNGLPLALVVSVHLAGMTAVMLRGAAAGRARAAGGGGRAGGN